MIVEKELCCGCEACRQICPFACIDMVCDEEGFYYPLIDSERCTSCGMCRIVCPAAKKEKKNEKE